jgi:hypothetical protein
MHHGELVALSLRHAVAFSHPFLAHLKWWARLAALEQEALPLNVALSNVRPTVMAPKHHGEFAALDCQTHDSLALLSQ